MKSDTMKKLLAMVLLAAAPAVAQEQSVGAPARINKATPPSAATPPTMPETPTRFRNHRLGETFEEFCAAENLAAPRVLADKHGKKQKLVLDPKALQPMMSNPQRNEYTCSLENDCVKSVMPGS